MNSEEVKFLLCKSEVAINHSEVLHLWRKVKLSLPIYNATQFRHFLFRTLNYNCNAVPELATCHLQLATYRQANLVVQSTLLYILTKKNLDRIWLFSIKAMEILKFM